MPLRIVKAFLGDRALPTAPLPAELEDVPSGSPYLRISLLAEAGLLQSRLRPSKLGFAN